MVIKKSAGRKIFMAFNNMIMVLLVVITAYPMLFILFASISKPNALLAHEGLLLAPLGFNLDSYAAVLKNPLILSGYINTGIAVAGGLAVNITMTIIGAYFFSRSSVMHQKKLMLMVVFTMFFGGGLIPTYLMLTGMGFKNNLLVLIIPGAVSTSNLWILRTSFYAVPKSLEDAAIIDGAGHLSIIKHVLVPLSLPTLAVLSLYSVVGHWNSWFTASIYITKKSLYPLQLLIREILIQNDVSTMVGADSSIADKVMISEPIKYATIIVSTVPILCLYPFLQKYFVKGVMIGAVKE